MEAQANMALMFGSLSQKPAEQTSSDCLPLQVIAQAKNPQNCVIQGRTVGCQCLGREETGEMLRRYVVQRTNE